MTIDKSIIFGDTHFPYHDEKSINVIKQIIKDNDFNEIILNGDIIDASKLSTKFINYEDYKTSFKEELLMFKDFVDELKELSPESKVVFVGDNHLNERLERYIRERIDVDCIREEITIDKLFNKFKIGVDEIVPYNKPYFPMNQRQIGCIHGYISSKYFSEKYTQKYTHSLIVNHTHTTQYYRAENGLECFGLGSLCDNLKYLRNQPVRWNKSFGILSYDNRIRKYFMNVYEIKNGYCMIGDKIYKG